jgi:hypothetical protein
MAANSKTAMTGFSSDTARDAAWLKCFAAAITGCLAADTAPFDVDNPGTVSKCMSLADEAIAAIDRRRPPTTGTGVLGG